MVQEAKEEDLKDIYSLICELEQEQINQEHFRDVYNQGLKSPHVKFYVYFYENKKRRNKFIYSSIFTPSWCYR